MLNFNGLLERIVRRGIFPAGVQQWRNYMHKLSAITLAATMALSTAAFGQAASVAVDLSGISADLAAELGIDADDLPTSIDLSAELAAEVCGVELGSIGDTCVATISNADLIIAIEDEIGEGEKGNSAREFAPGQQEGEAKDAAPGQQDGDAKDFAPGQVKKTDDSHEAGHGNETAPGQTKKSN
jgi:hypothetical protein